MEGLLGFVIALDFGAVLGVSDESDVSLGIVNADLELLEGILLVLGHHIERHEDRLRDAVLLELFLIFGFGHVIGGLEFWVVDDLQEIRAGGERPQDEGDQPSQEEGEYYCFNHVGRESRPNICRFVNS